MTVNGIIDKDLKILISTNCKSDAVLDDNVDFVTSDKSNPETPQRTPIQNQINAPVIETAPLITSQKTPNIPINSDKLREIKFNMIAMKSTFMNEIYELKNGISLLRLLNDRNESKEPENSQTFWKLKSYFLKRKIQFYVRSLKMKKKQLICF